MISETINHLLQQECLQGVLAADTYRPEVPECVAVRDALLQRITALSLPANFLDELIQHLGGPGLRPHYHCTEVAQTHV